MKKVNKELLSKHNKTEQDYSSFLNANYTGRGSTGYRGVAFYSNTGMFHVLDGRSVVGTFDTLEDALVMKFLWGVGLGEPRIDNSDGDVRGESL